MQKVFNNINMSMPCGVAQRMINEVAVRVKASVNELLQGCQKTIFRGPVNGIKVFVVE
jgi:hypothetical protein